ncbi:hypothetical protein PPYR_11509 [Photinus pyralis]|uniref:PIH1 N-terminal domain-containing protein n=2 Tax=Photinus pyralis TaxID=7054 RepID=A0A1Y1N962_PHOPY|nr:PIH1 domain-containing protein 1-like [Photinus pyralis]KAB0794670.1 hypothetical protein PPYR_11509 [Photinus pyralis]
MGPKPVFLDVDSTIVEKNLRITNDSDEITQLLEREEQYPSKLIKPIPGFCVKTKEIGTNEKLFVNICQTDALPPPDDISESQLADICNSDEICNYKIPLSIGEVRNESDKKGIGAKAVDIAINTKFMYKIENSVLFKNFLLTVVFEGLRDKYNLHMTDERVILKNKKAYGTLQLHRIQQREIQNTIASIKGEEQILIDTNRNAQPFIQVLSSSEKSIITPKYRLFRRKGENNLCYCEIQLRAAPKSRDFMLEVGEDRVVFESKASGYFLDIYLPFSINFATSTYNTCSKILTVKMSTC